MSIFSEMFRETASKSDWKRDEKLVIPNDVEAFYNINYAGDDEKYHLLDVYRPCGCDKNLPVIINVHGGGYVYGMKENYIHYGMFIAKQGFIFVNGNYHLAPEYHFPTQLEEINAIVTWIMSHGEKYGMDLKNIFMVGDSAGAQMLSQYATIVTNPEYEKLFAFRVPKDFHIQAIGLNCGMYTFDVEVGDEDTSQMNRALFFDYFGKEVRDVGSQARVLDYITDSFPPTYLMTSFYDFLRNHAEPMYLFLKERGIRTEYKCYGKEGETWMAHVCHVNMNLKEAKKMNCEELDFFRRCVPRQL